MSAQPPGTLRKSTRSGSPASRGGGLDGYFRITERGSTVGREVRGGLVTFFTMVYIVFLNPIILGGAFKAQHPSANATIAIATGTALIAALACLAMGPVGRYPFALAAGLGIN